MGENPIVVKSKAVETADSPLPLRAVRRYAVVLPGYKPERTTLVAVAASD